MKTKQNKNGHHQVENRFLHMNSLEIHYQSRLFLIADARRGAIFAFCAKIGPKVLKMWYFAYSAAQWRAVAPPRLRYCLLSILVIFQKQEIMLVCDILEIYLQIELFEADRRLHRFLWRNWESDRDPDVYKFQRLVFGVNAFPFLAQFVLREHANATPPSLSQVSNAILHASYMDDAMTSLIDEQQA